MHLTQLTIRGFKSFASATTMKLEPGITCVVGPNGSGKSNVVDALSWVMGEQGAKSLRGGKMEDVIFAGTSKRQALGRAEVSLTIDNSDGLLPIEYSEVTISRTLFRAGGSEYAINGEPARLLDIQELLSDTGMGREMHVIVGQGRLDSVLQATPEDRRGFIEEAAGVLKHRRRKEKALRKLEAMAANLARVSDLTAEIRRQLGPLARQAAVARRAQVIQAEVRDARLRILADDLVQAIAMFEQDSADMSAMKKRQDEVAHAYARLSEELAGAEAEAAHAAPHLAAATDAYYALTATRERFRSLSQLAGERVRNLSTPISAPAGRDPDELDQRAAEAHEAEQNAAAQVARLSDELSAASEFRSETEARERQAETTLATLHRAAADRREGLAKLSGRVGVTRSRLEAVQDEAERRTADVAEARVTAEDAAREFAALEQRIAGDEESEERLDRAHERAVAAADVARARLAELDAQEREATAAALAAEARRDALAMSMERKDGTGELLADDTGRAARGVLGALPQFLHIEAGWEDAVAATLGSLVDAALVSDGDQRATVAAAVDLLRSARETKGGHVRLVLAAPASSAESRGAVTVAAPLGELREGELPEDELPEDELPEGARAVTDLVNIDDDAPAGLVHAVRTLLAGVVAVDGLAQARETLTVPGVERCVTREGDLLGTTWASGGGPATPSVLQIHAAHEAAVREHEDATARIAQLRDQRGPAQHAVNEAEQTVAATLADLHESDARLSAITEKLGHLGAAQRAAEERVARAEPAIARATQEAATLREELSALLVRLQAAQQEPQTAEAQVEDAGTARTQAADSSRQARSRETEARLALRTAEERATSLQGRAASLRSAAQQERDARKRATQQEARRVKREAAARSVQGAAHECLHALETSVERAGQERDHAQEARRHREEDLARIRRQREEASAELTKLKDAAHREEVARAEQKMRVDHLRERALEGLGIDPDVLVEEYGPHLEVPEVAALVEAHQAGEEPAEVPAVPFVRADQEKRLAKAERDLTRLGKVNPLALEEHAALEERHTFLTTQLTDLEKSREDLLGIVKDIDDRVERVFTEAFEDTAREFIGVFSRLFPGGEGRLVLTDPQDMLTTGIEIEARPAGKKVKRLSLLSGGERSLTAVALLVAIFKARPSPFYVMDEVEAALDDVNLGRLLDILRELQENSQLIVITHQKRTMEIADALYGITMRDGVTEVISQRVERPSSEPAALAAT